MADANIPKQPLGGKRPGRRNGAFLVLALFCLVITMIFVAFAIELGVISMTKNRMQNAVDAAALAGISKLAAAIEGSPSDMPTAVAHGMNDAKAAAVFVAQQNGVYVNPATDVQFGHRSYDEATGEFHTTWGAAPANTIKIVARRDNNDPTQPDAKLPVLFGGVLGVDSATLSVEATAHITPRDVVAVLDFSRSMNFDSYFTSSNSNPLPIDEIKENMHTVWADLGSPAFGNMSWDPNWVTIPTVDNEVEVTWKSTEVEIHAVDYNDPSDFTRATLFFEDGSRQIKIPPAFPMGQTVTFAGTGASAGLRIVYVGIRDDGVGELINFYNDSHIMRGLGLSTVPYPWAVGSWEYFIQMCRDHNPATTPYYQLEIYEQGYRRKFGLMLFIYYLLRFESSFDETEDLWRTRHYPFHIMKRSTQKLCTVLADLGYGDHVGMVSFDSSHRVEAVLSHPGMPAVDVSSDPLGEHHNELQTIIEHKQCSHYSDATNLGGGLRDAKSLLLDHGREGACRTIVLLSDGSPNTVDSGETTTLPDDWDWDALLDYDGDGLGDYTTSNSFFQHSLKLAKECVDAEVTVHTVSIGSDPDARDLMQAIAFLGRGIHIHVPNGTSVPQMESALHNAFERIATTVPAVQLSAP